MVVAMITMIKMGGCFLPPSRDYSEASGPSPAHEVSSPPAPESAWVWLSRWFAWGAK